MSNNNEQRSEVVPTAKRTRKRYGITPEVFVVVWQQSSSAKEASEKLTEMVGKLVPKDIVLARASFYRKKGVVLKSMSRDHRQLDVPGLNNAIEHVV